MVEGRGRKVKQCILSKYYDISIDDFTKLSGFNFTLYMYIIRIPNKIVPWLYIIISNVILYVRMY